MPDVRTAQHAWEKSCYFNIDYKIDEGDNVFDAISRMSAYNVGCLIVTKNGVVSACLTVTMLCWQDKSHLGHINIYITYPI